MTDALATTRKTALASAGASANQAAAAHIFTDYRSRKAPNTIAAQDADLRTFAVFLNSIRGMPTCAAADLGISPACWDGLTWGIVEAFVKWMLLQGYATSSVNRKLSTVKAYAKLATKASVIDGHEFQMIRAVRGYGRKEARRVNDNRPRTRISPKKAEHVRLEPDQAAHLKTGQTDTPQGIRDALLFSLLLDHGLRVGEVAALRVEDVKLTDGTFTFYRPKVDKTQTHRMTRDTAAAMRTYFADGHAPTSGQLLRGSRKDGTLTDDRMSARAITKRVRAIGETIGIDSLSAHDCRHYWATQAARNGSTVFALQDAGGWNSPAMPARYVEAAAVANEGIKLE